MHINLANVKSRITSSLIINWMTDIEQINLTVGLKAKRKTNLIPGHLSCCCKSL